MNVVYLYQHAARELDVACAVKYLARRHFGLEVEVAHWRVGITRLLNRLHPSAVALPFCYNLSDYSSLLLGWRKSVFINLAWEQLLSSATMRAKVPADTYSREHVIHHAWGGFYAKYLEACGVPEANIFLNGNPSYMLYQEPYRNYFPGRSELARQFQLDPERKWVFFPENYGWAFYSDSELDEGPVKRGMARHEAYGIREYARKSFEEVIRWCAQSLTRNEVEIIIRPRPATPLTEFAGWVRRELGTVPERMRIIKDGSVREWILASDVVVSSYSTSLIEAAVADKPVYILEPQPFPKFLYVDWYDKVGRIRTGDDFYDICAANIIPDGSGGLGEWARQEMLGRGDPILGLTEFLFKISATAAHRPAPPRRKDSVLPSRLNVPGWLQGCLYEYRRAKWKRLRWNEGAQMEAFPIEEQDVFSELEIGRRAERWGQMLRDYSPCAGGASSVQSLVA